MANDLVRLGQLLGGNKNIVGNKYSDLVLETLGKVYIKTGNNSRVLNDVFKLLDKFNDLDDSENVSKTIITEDLESLQYPGDGILVFDAKNKALYISYDLRYILLIDSLETENSSKYVKKTGDTMTGTLVIKSSGAPLIVASSELVRNLNVEYLGGYSASRFAVKTLNERIYGQWSFLSKTTFNAPTEFNDKVIHNDNIFINNADIVTTGSMGSPVFASGFGGYGWRFDATTNMLTVDYLVVRKAMLVFELVVNQIKATNGSLWVTDSGEIDEVWEVQYINDQNLNEALQDTWYIPYSESDWPLNIKAKHLCDSSGRAIDSDFYNIREVIKYEGNDPITVEVFNKAGYLYTTTTTPSFFSTNLKKTFSNLSTDVNEIYTYYKYFGNKEKPVHKNKATNIFIIKMNEDTVPTFKEGDLVRCQKFLDGNIKYYDALIGNNFDTYYYVIFLAESVFDLYTVIEYDENGELKQLTGDDVKNNTVMYEKTLQDVESEENYSDAYNKFLKLSELYEGELLKLQAIILLGSNYPINAWMDNLGYDYESYKNSIIGRDLSSDNTFMLTQVSKGDAIVRIGHLWDKDRQNSVFITSSELYSPYVQTMSGISRPDYSVLYTEPKFKTRSKIIDGKIKELYYEIYEDEEAFYELINSTAGKSLYDIEWVEDNSNNAVNMEFMYLTSLAADQTTEEIVYFVDGEKNQLPDINTNAIELDKKYKKQFLLYKESPTLTCAIEKDKKGKYLSTYTNHVKARFGKLDGIYNEVLGEKLPRGYGLYGENVFLTGEFYLNNGTAVADIGDDIRLEVSNSFGKAGLYVLPDKKGKPYIVLKADLIKVLTQNGTETALFTNGRIEASLLRISELLAAECFNSYVYKGTEIVSEDGTETEPEDETVKYEKQGDTELILYKTNPDLCTIKTTTNNDGTVVFEKKKAIVTKHDKFGKLKELSIDGELKPYEEALILYVIDTDDIPEDLEKYKIEDNGIDAFDVYIILYTYNKNNEKYNYARTDEEIIQLAKSISTYVDTNLIKRDANSYVYSEINTSEPFVKADAETGILSAYGAELLGGKLELRDNYEDPTIKVNLGINDNKPGLQIFKKNSEGEWNLNTTVEGTEYTDPLTDLAPTLEMLSTNLSFDGDKYETTDITWVKTIPYVAKETASLQIDNIILENFEITSTVPLIFKYTVSVGEDEVFSSNWGDLVAFTKETVPINIGYHAVESKISFEVVKGQSYNIIYSLTAKSLTYQNIEPSILVSQHTPTLTINSSITDEFLVTRLYGNGLFIGSNSSNYLNVHRNKNNELSFKCIANDNEINLEGTSLKLLNKNRFGIEFNTDGINFINGSHTFKMPVLVYCARYEYNAGDANNYPKYLAKSPLGGLIYNPALPTEINPMVTIAGDIISMSFYNLLTNYNINLENCIITLLGEALQTENSKVPIYATIWNPPTLKLDFENGSDTQTLEIRLQDDNSANLGNFRIKIETIE